MAKVSEKIEKNYAKTLFELCSKESHEHYLYVLNEWIEIFQNAPEVQDLLSNPAFQECEKNQLIREILQEFCPNDEIIVNFFIELTHNRRLSELKHIRDCYIALLQKEQGVEAVEVISAYSIIDEEKNELQIAIEKTLNSKVVIDWSVDESLIGGLIIKIGDAVIDNSIKGALKNIKQELLA